MGSFFVGMIACDSVYLDSCTVEKYIYYTYLYIYTPYTVTVIIIKKTHKREDIYNNRAPNKENYNKLDAQTVPGKD